MEQLKKNYDAVRAIIKEGDLYSVGGCVRDAIMGNAPKDWDYTTNLTPDEMEPLIRAAGRRVYETGRRFGTLGFKVEIDGEFELIEITTFRTEYYDGKTRKPEVKWATTLKEDLSRRDFSINAIAYDGNKLIDYFGGRLDIHAGLIKSVGLPKERIMEDALRMLRAARFAARYGFEIDPNFIGEARQLAGRIYDVSVERWVQELDKLLTADYPRTGLLYLKDMGLLSRILPEVVELGVLRHDPDPDLAWKYLLEKVHADESVARYMMGGICQRFKFSNSRTDVILGKS